MICQGLLGSQQEVHHVAANPNHTSIWGGVGGIRLRPTRWCAVSSR